MAADVWVDDRMARVLTMGAGNKIGNVVVGMVMWQWEIVLWELKISLFVTTNEECFRAITKLRGIYESCWGLCGQWSHGGSRESA